MRCPCREEGDGATGEELGRETSKCLFMPNWAADEPAAVSDNSRSGREEETDAKEGKDGEVRRGEMRSSQRTPARSE